MGRKRGQRHTRKDTEESDHEKQYSNSSCPSLLYEGPKIVLPSQRLKQETQNSGARLNEHGKHVTLREMDIYKLKCQEQCYFIYNYFGRISGFNVACLNPTIAILGESVENIIRIAMSKIVELENTIAQLQKKEEKPSTLQDDNLEVKLEKIIDDSITKAFLLKFSDNVEPTNSSTKIDASKPKTFAQNYKIVVNPKKAGTKIFKEMTSKIDPSKEGIRIDFHKELKTGSVEIRCERKEDIEKLKNKLSEIENIEVKEISKRNPQLIIHDIPISLATEDILENVIEKTVIDVAGIKPDAIRLVKYKKPNTDKQMAYVTIGVAGWRKLLDEKKMFIEWSMCTVKEYVPLIKCKKCLKLGHVEKYCNSDKVELPEDYCFHCRKFNQKKSSKEPNRPEDHVTFSKECPTLKTHIIRLYSKIDYGGEEPENLLRRLHFGQ